jgi:RNA polymerase sigma-B factor
MTMAGHPRTGSGASSPEGEDGSGGDRDRLIAENLGLATHLARRFARRGQPAEDLQQVAYLGLVVAASRYDPDRGLAFSTFATATIVGAIKHHFRDHGWSVRAPRALQELATEVRMVVEELTQTQGRSPTIREVARACGRREDEVLRAMEAVNAYRSTSIDAPDVETDAIRSLVGGDVESLEQHDELWSHFGRLTVRDQTLLHLRFVDELSQAEIAERTGLSQVHVSRLLRRALDRLRASFDDAR